MKAKLTVVNHKVTSHFLFYKIMDCSRKIKKTVADTIDKCKKHSLSHQLAAQLHIENSKNKKW